jgi:hypothetical protein
MFTLTTTLNTSVAKLGIVTAQEAAISRLIMQTIISLVVVLLNELLVLSQKSKPVGGAY